MGDGERWIIPGLDIDFSLFLRLPLSVTDRMKKQWTSSNSSSTTSSRKEAQPHLNKDCRAVWSPPHGFLADKSLRLLHFSRFRSHSR